MQDVILTCKKFIFEKIPEVYLGRNETGLYEQCVKIQIITLWFHLVKDTQLCSIDAV